MGRPRSPEIATRNAEIYRLYIKLGWKAKKIACFYGLKEVTQIYRIVKEQDMARRNSDGMTLEEITKSKSREGIHNCGLSEDEWPECAGQGCHAAKDCNAFKKYCIAHPGYEIHRSVRY